MNEKINQCPLVDWFRFKNQCQITTCKNNTHRLSSGCLGLEHKFPSGDKVMTDSELLLYKFKDERTTIRTIAAIRKKALNQVRYCLLLEKYIEHLDNNAKRRDFVYLPGTDKRIDKALAKSPLRFKQIGYKQWMLPYIASEKHYKKFVKRVSADRRIRHSDVLFLRPKEYRDFVRAVRKL